MKPYYEHGGITIYHADCREVLPQLGQFDLLLTDPPYGINANKQTLGSGQKRFHRSGDWDKEAPEYLEQLMGLADKCCLWGGNYFQLPKTNDWLCWHKLNDGLSFSEFELAWTNFGKQCRHLQHHWGSEKKLHPTQKPLPVIRWCLRQADMPEAGSIFDPFMGSGTTLEAAKLNGYTATGIEIDEKYCEIAANRLAQEVLF